ncbi:MAG TPA: M57 family metalloprotease [Candidatus Nanopelagicales bacterium]|nr:M57 family metalloprotease [Candidatus Nanopelagicales bacterium]
MSKTEKSMSRAVSLLATIAGVALLGTACVAEPAEPGEIDENVDQVGMSWDEFLSVVTVEDETGYFIVDGDIPIYTMPELERFYEAYIQPGALAVYRSGATDIKWSNSQKLNLTYCVSTTFGSRYNEVVQAMASAAGAWESAANVDFKHLSQYDSNCTKNQNNVVFDVRPVNGGQYLARAFFPNSSRGSRNVLIDSTAFNYGNSPSVTGVLRHELGHTLGFRHEHTRPEAGTCFEDNQWRALTPYDSDSVMHYPQCNGTGDWSLVLTNDDKAGAAALYGN